MKPPISCLSPAHIRCRYRFDHGCIVSLARCFLLQSRDGAFPAELWLGVSREAISVYKRGEPWPLEVFPYEQILSFGAPLPNAYKIAVEGRELVFETQMVSPDGFGLL